MYLNIKVKESDQAFLNIFFREHPSHPLKVVRLTSHPFGLSSSPYVAMKVVHQHAQERMERYPLTKRVIENCAIVDDFIVSGDHVPQLKSTRQQLQNMLDEIKMPLHKMASNHPDILQGVPEDKIAKTKTVGEDDVEQSSVMPTIKTLGVVWNSQADTLAIQFQPKHLDSDLTLRMVVSEGGRYYDPLGITLPVVMTMQDSATVLLGRKHPMGRSATLTSAITMEEMGKSGPRHCDNPCTTSHKKPHESP